MKNGFVFYASWWEAIKNLPRDVQGDVLTAIVEYGISGETTGQLKPITKALLALVKPQIDSNNQRYENGRKGGRPKGDTDLTGIESELDENQRETKREPKKNQRETKREPKKNQTATYKGISKKDKEKKESSTDVEDKKEPPSPPTTLDGEIALLKGDECWLDQLQALHGMDLGALRAKLDEFGLHCKADGMERHDDIADAKRHFNNWLRITASKRDENGNNRVYNGKDAKQEANEYAMRLLAERLDEAGDGVPDAVPPPF